MNLFGKRDVVRQCTQCGTTWTVPGKLARRRRRRRGISYRQRSMFNPGSLTNASAQFTLELANQQDRLADATDQITISFKRCPSCDAPTYMEVKSSA